MIKVKMELRKHLNTTQKKHIKAGADEEYWGKEFKDAYIETREYLVYKNVEERINVTLILDFIENEDELQFEESYEYGVFYDEGGDLIFIDLSRFLGYLNNYDYNLIDEELKKDTEETVNKIINDLREYECYDLWVD